MSTRLLLAPLLLSFALTGCVYHSHDRGRGDGHRGYGPPPHAPAHGHRAKHHGHNLEFDSRRGVYLVVGLPGVFWHGGWYYRQWRDRWQRCTDGDGPWHDARWGDVPTGLRGGRGDGHGDGHGHGKGKGKGKGHGQDKDW